MSPDELADRHPRLYHLAARQGLAGILKNGLLPASELLTLFETPAMERSRIEDECRPAHVSLQHAQHGHAIITDNSPLSLHALATCLDDGLSPQQWLRMLNSQTFFWVRESDLHGLAGAKRSRERDLIVLVFDTRRVARHHHARMELCAINSGATIRRPVRRGLATFTPLGKYDYRAWQELRGKQDRIREVTLVGGLPDVEAYLLETRETPGHSQDS